jgi:hypothetical protein
MGLPIFDQASMCTSIVGNRHTKHTMLVMTIIFARNRRNNQF